jgi:hypothetical protein
METIKYLKGDSIMEPNEIMENEQVIEAVETATNDIPVKGGKDKALAIGAGVVCIIAYEVIVRPALLKGISFAWNIGKNMYVKHKKQPEIVDVKAEPVSDQEATKE